MCVHIFVGDGVLRDDVAGVAGGAAVSARHESQSGSPVADRLRAVWNAASAWWKFGPGLSVDLT